MTTTFEDVLARGGSLLGVWDLARGRENDLAIYELAESGLSRLASKRVPAGDRSVMIETLREHRVPVGATYGSRPFIWAADPATFTIWTLAGVEFEGTKTDLRRAGHSLASPASVEAVVSFVDPDDLGHRGVALVLRDGRRSVIAEERDAAAELDPAYNVDNLTIDGAWATYLGRELSGWLGVDHRDELP